MTGLVWLCKRETLRVSKLWTQTVLAPVVSSMLFILVFGLSLGGRIKQVGDVEYEVFIVPGATPSSAALDMARSTTRRAERAVVALERDRPTNPEVRRYLNRLSDLLFVLARWEAGESEPASR